MTQVEPHETAAIEFHYDQKYRNMVAEHEDPDQWISVSISVGDEDIYGGSRSVVTGFACLVVLDLLDTTEAIYGDERAVVSFDYGPSWLSVAPIDETTVEIAACHTLKGAKDPDERLDVDRVEYVTRRAWEDSVLDLAHKFHETIVEINPELEGHQVIRQIQEKRADIARSREQ